MLFKLSTAGCCYTDEVDRAKLSEYGFSFRVTENGFKIKGEPTIEITTLEELVQFIGGVGSNIVISIRDGLEIIIYDNYLE